MENQDRLEQRRKALRRRQEHEFSPKSCMWSRPTFSKLLDGMANVPAIAIG